MPGFENSFKKALIDKKTSKTTSNSKNNPNSKTTPNSKKSINNEEEMNRILNRCFDEMIAESSQVSLELSGSLNRYNGNSLKEIYKKLNDEHREKLNSIKSNKKIKVGIIKAHGSILRDKFCLVPDNLQLIIPIRKGISYCHGNNLNHSSLLLRETNRRDILSLLNEEGCKIILEGTLIHDAILSFSIFYPGTTNDPTKFTDYSFTGIITSSIFGGSFSSGNRLLRKIIVKQSMNEYKPLFNEMHNYHNSDIIPSKLLFMKKFYLSEILVIISQYKNKNPHIKIPSLFYLLSCREYNRSLGDTTANLVRQPSNSQPYISIFYKFFERIKLKLEKKNENINQDILFILTFLKLNCSINYKTLNFLINLINDVELGEMPDLKLSHTVNFMSFIELKYNELYKLIIKYNPKYINIGKLC
jgi:hypothetical protein